MGVISDLKKKTLDSLDAATVERIRDQTMLRLRSDPRIIARWMGYCGVDRAEDVDYENPCVYIEWCACDPSILELSDDPERFVEATGCDRETFLRHFWSRSEEH